MRTTLYFLLFATALSVHAADIRPYEGYGQDRALLRDTCRLTNPPLNASSGEAMQAAHRLFSRLTFVGLTRENVLAILGDPETISDYGVAASTPDSSLTYCFDSGLGGTDYVIAFRHGIAITVKMKHFS
jgi:hypothetical protein